MKTWEYYILVVLSEINSGLLDEELFLSFSTNGYSQKKCLKGRAKWYIFQQLEANGLSQGIITKEYQKTSKNWVSA